MKNIPHSFGKFLYPVTLYLDDLEEIVGILNNPPSAIMIQTDRMQFDNLQELGTLTVEQLFKLSISNDDVSLSMEPNQIWLFAHNDGPIAQGQFEQIRRLVNNRSTIFKRILQRSSVSGIIAGIGIILTFDAVLASNTNKIILGILLISFAVGYGIASFRLNINRYSTIVLARKKDRPSFIKRNKDSIWIAIISAILGGLITVLISKFFGAG